MNVCIIGDGLTSLLLAKSLISKNINVSLFYNKKRKKKIITRTIGLAKANFNYVNSNILNIMDISWNIKKIEIYSEKNLNKKILNFDNDRETLFTMVKSHELYNKLSLTLKKNKLFKKKIITSDHLLKGLIINNDYDLILNCDYNNYFTNKFFHRKLKKNYNNFAYTTLMKHKPILQNNVATQIFTEKGPIAFLPISKNKTSIVYSISSKNRITNELEIIKLIRKYNPNFNIYSFSEINSFKIESSNLRKYFYKNILAFGDLLHKIHPLAGQGFNMTIRDLIELLNIIQSKIDLGLQLDSSICLEFEKKTKHKNFTYSSGVDFIYEFFNLEKKIKNKNIINFINLVGNKKKINKYLIKFADNGFSF